MKRFSCVMMALAFICLVSGSAFATTLTHAKAKVEITVPDTWKSAQDGDVMTLSAPDDSMSVVFMIMDSAAADKAFESIDKDLEKNLGPITWANDGKAIDEKINDMPTSEWNGKTKDGKMMVDCLSIDTPSDKALGVYWFSTEESEKKYEADIATIVKGLKPLK
ncbi:MAG: hypothetical protein HQM09_09080 [Candidatus Riflebacteria bacterium]|nr:hypothetical protein [Candidatus Riflebacteria bacterium]